MLRQNGTILLNQHCCCDCIPACFAGKQLSVTISGITANVAFTNACISTCLITNPFHSGVGTTHIDLTGLNGAYTCNHVSGGRFVWSGIQGSPCNPDIGILVASRTASGCDCQTEVRTYLSQLIIDIACDRSTGQMYIDQGVLFDFTNSSAVRTTPCGALSQPGFGPWQCASSYYIFDTYVNQTTPYVQIQTAPACKTLRAMSVDVKWPPIRLIPPTGGFCYDWEFDSSNTDFPTNGFISAELLP